MHPESPMGASLPTAGTRGRAPTQIQVDAPSR